MSATASLAPAPRRIGLIGFNGVNGIDLLGPAEAFAFANEIGLQQRPAAVPYEILILGLDEAPFTTESGARLLPQTTLSALGGLAALDTLIVPGGAGLRVPACTEAVAAWLRGHASGIRRIASVCTGLYGLASSGLLDGRRVATHWRFADDLRQRYPQLQIDGDALFIKDPPYYTAGGVTASIDLALALIEEDLGPAVALGVAREFVVYLKRSGGQQQYSEPLRFQTRARDRFADLIAWIDAHLHEALSIDVLAAQAGLSPRHFSRRFREQFGCTPAEYVERTRLDQACERLLGSSTTIDAIARRLGYASADVFRRRFEQRFGLTPGEYRRHFSAS